MYSYFLLPSDCELFVFEILHDENLSESAEETRQVLLNNFRVVHARWDLFFLTLTLTRNLQKQH